MENNEMRPIVIDGRQSDIAGIGVTADEVLRRAGVMGEGIAVRIDGGRATLLAPGSILNFEITASPSFRTFRGARLYHLRVDGSLWDWGSPAITEDDIREIANLDEDQFVVSGSSGTPLRRGGLVDLTGEWPPELRNIRSGPIALSAGVPVFVNGRSLMLEREEVTFEDLVGLAFPGSDPASPGMRSLTVSYRKGPLARPEGSLISRQATRLTKGQIFNVTATDKS